MGPSEKSFQQVKSILGKLDRSIDSVRQARLQPGTPSTPVTTPAPIQAVQPVAQAKPPVVPIPAATPAARPAFGRAQPLPRPNNSNPGGKWL